MTDNARGPQELLGLKKKQNKTASQWPTHYPAAPQGRLEHSHSSGRFGGNGAQSPSKIQSFGIMSHSLKMFYPSKKLAAQRDPR